MLQFLRHGSLSCCVSICVQVLHGTCVCRVHVVRLFPEDASVVHNQCSAPLCLCACLVFVFVLCVRVCA